MRFLVLLIVACSSPPSTLPDGGAFADGGFTCVPGRAFCADGLTWTCTLRGSDADLADTCIRTIGVTTYDGYCSEQHCDGGQEVGSSYGLFCCLPD